uniref:Uncharacterized protein n=1 Tax=Caenorhabditis tropicalis TaxID=1561998 RepID=A0A1I7T425_9PELO
MTRRGGSEWTPEGAAENPFVQFSASISIEVVVFRLKMSEWHFLNRWQGEAEASGHPKEQQRNKQFVRPSAL